MLNRNTLQKLPSHLSLDDLVNKFADFFEDKILKIRDRLSKVNQELGGSSCSSTKKCLSSCSDVIPASHDDISNILMSSASKSCPLDPMPTTILKDCLDVILPVITKIVNLFLSTSVMPGKLKEAILAPSIKKAILDAELLKNFRSIFNLAFTSKIVEKVLDSQLESYITANNLYDPLQSAYKELHSTETALVKVTNDILCAVVNKKLVILVLLDLSAAFDTVDHKILLHTLEYEFGIIVSTLCLD